MKDTIVIAVDPGVSGGIAVADGETRVYATSMPKTEGDVVTLFKQIGGALDRDQRPKIAYIEDQTFYAGVQVSAPAMGKFGRQFGFLLGVLMATGWRVELIRPQKWQKALSLGTRVTYQSRCEWKNHLKACAQRLYPEVHVTLATADALLILDYALRQDELVQ